MGNILRFFGKLSLIYPLSLLSFSGHAQCLSGNCYAFAEASSLQICRGQQVTLTSEGGAAALFNNFNNQSIGTGWITNNINASFNNPCGPNGSDGTPYLWFGGPSGVGQRELVSVDFNLTGGGSISFDLRFAIQGQAAPCEGPDLANEGVYLQYSTNFGASWNTIFYFDPNINGSGGGAASPYVNWATYSYPIPLAAQTPCTRFRWYQDAISVGSFDHWGLDNIFIGGPPPDPSSIVFQWTDGVPGGPNRIVAPQVTTTYTLMYGTSADTCYDSVTIEVFDVPEANLTATPALACVGQPVSFDASGSQSTTPITNYKWRFNNSGVVNQTTTSPTTTFTFPITGTFNTSVIVTSGICSDTAFFPVSVTNPPTVNFTIPSQVCEGQVFQVNASATTIGAPATIASYAWDFYNDGITDITTNQPISEYSLSGPGPVPVKLTVTSSAGCALSSVQNMTVFEIPEVDFSFNDACIGTATQFTNQTQGTVTQWGWNFDGLGTSVSENPNYTFPGAGVYSVTLIANNNNVCADTLSLDVDIKNTATADFSFNDPCTLAAIFEDLSFVPPTSEGSIVSWSWNFGNGSQTSDQNPTHTYNNNGVYNVTLTVETDRGCVNSITKQMPRYALPVAAFSAAEVCFGQITQFANTSSVASGQIASSSWQFGDGQGSTNFSPAYSYDADGFYTVTLIVVTDNNCSDTVSQNYQVYPQPVPAFESDPNGITDMLSPDVLFTDLSTNADSWTWTFGTIGGSAEQNPLFSFPTSGSYDITLIAQNQYGCKAAVTQGYEVLPAYNFYVPNSFTPFNGDDINSLFRSYHTGVDILEFGIYNRWGEQILFTRDVNFTWDGTFRGKRCTQGLYVYKAWVRDIEGKHYFYEGIINLLDGE